LQVKFGFGGISSYILLQLERVKIRFAFGGQLLDDTHYTNISLVTTPKAGNFTGAFDLPRGAHIPQSPFSEFLVKRLFLVLRGGRLMESREKRKKVAFSSILGVALAFQLCAAPAALGQIYNDGATHDVDQADVDNASYYYSARIDGEGTVVNFNASIRGGVYVSWTVPGATLNYGNGNDDGDVASANLIYAGYGSQVNLYGGSVSWMVFTDTDAQVTVYGDYFTVEGDAETYYPGATISVQGAVLTAYDSSGETRFTGRMSCSALALDTDSEELAVEIDVKPDSDPSIINLNSNGLVAVAVLSDDDVDATQIQPETVEFAGAPVAVNGSGKYMASVVDVDGDGDDDMLFHFNIADLDLDAGITEAEVKLTGQLGGEPDTQVMAKSLQSTSPVVEGTPIAGSENVQVVQPKKKKK
jgi:hypothetical protein